MPSILKCSINMVLLYSKACISGRSVGMENIVLVSEDIIVYVVLLGRLGRQHERLHERTHRSIVVGKLTNHLTADIQVSSNNGFTQLIHTRGAQANSAFQVGK